MVSMLLGSEPFQVIEWASFVCYGLRSTAIPVTIDAKPEAYPAVGDECSAADVTTRLCPPQTTYEDEEGIEQTLSEPMSFGCEGPVSIMRFVEAAVEICGKPAGKIGAVLVDCPGDGMSGHWLTDCDAYTQDLLEAASHFYYDDGSLRRDFQATFAAGTSSGGFLYMQAEDVKLDKPDIEGTCAASALISFLSDESWAGRWHLATVQLPFVLPAPTEADLAGTDLKRVGMQNVCLRASRVLACMWPAALPFLRAGFHVSPRQDKGKSIY
eukprot:3545065-Prymnesium_polylepis.1